MTRKVVFLDRDGVINDGTLYYTYKVEDFKFNEGVVQGLQLLIENGYDLIVVTNQGGVAKGQYTAHDVEMVHSHMKAYLEAKGVPILATYFCPHHSDVMDCECRKPKPGMLTKAIEQFDIDLSRSFLIGDSPRDIEAGNAVRVTSILINKNENIIPYCKQIISQSQQDLHM